MSLTAPVAAGTKIAGKKNADQEEISTVRLATIAADGDAETPISSSAPLPVRDAALAGYVDGIEAAIAATNTALGLLNGYTDGQEGLLTDLKGLLTTQATFLDGLETLVGTTNTSLGNIAGFVDTLETLTTTTNSLITTLNGYVDGIEGLIGTTNTALTTLGTYVDGLEASAASQLAAIQNLAPLSAIVAVTPSGTVFTVSRALIATADMTANLTVGGTDIDNVPLNRGINPIAATKVRAVSGGSVFRAN